MCNVQNDGTTQGQVIWHGPKGVISFNTTLLAGNDTEDKYVISKKECFDIAVDYRLEIRNISAEDEGEYWCECIGHYNIDEVFINVRGMWLYSGERTC